MDLRSHLRSHRDQNEIPPKANCVHRKNPWNPIFDVIPSRNNLWVILFQPRVFSTTRESEPDILPPDAETKIPSARAVGPAFWNPRGVGGEPCFTCRCPAFWHGGQTSSGCPMSRVRTETCLRRGSTLSIQMNPDLPYSLSSLSLSLSLKRICSQLVCWQCCLCCISHRAHWEDEVHASQTPVPTRSVRACWIPGKRIMIASRKSWWASLNVTDNLVPFLWSTHFLNPLCESSYERWHSFRHIIRRIIS